MRRIIHRKMYDTDTATCLGRYDNGYGRGDFNYIEESLYRKKSGELFLHGIGGAMTGYSKRCGQNSWKGGEEIIPLSETGAKKWAEKRISADEYETIFGKVEE